MRFSHIVSGFIAAALPVSYVPARASHVDPMTVAPYRGLEVADVLIRGNAITREFVIRRELQTAPGDSLDADTLERDVTRLENLGIFSSVRVDLVENGPGVDVTFDVREMPWIVPYPIAGYTEQNGWSLGAGVASINLSGRDITLFGSAQFGGINTFETGIGYPWIAGNHVSLDLYIAHLERDDELNEFREKSNEITPWLGTYLGRHGRARGMVGWFNMRSDVDGKTLDDDNSDNFVRGALVLGYDNRDSWRDPGRGAWSTVEAMYSYEPDLERGFATATLDLRQFVSPSERNTLMSGLLVDVQSGTVDRDVPHYMIYRMGGANSIRGYDFNKLGREIYGKNQFLFTVEEQVLLKRIQEYRMFGWTASIGLQGALFLDYGTAWSDPAEFRADRFRVGGGVSLRLLVPAVDMLRFDLGFGEGGSVRLHLATQNKLQAQRWRIR